MNDNLPQIYIPDEKETITIKEQTFANLFTTAELYIEDLDLGPHATYEVILTHRDENVEVEYSDAFTIVPSSGYQKQSFAISVTNTNLIDFEDELWQSFEITVRASMMKNYKMKLYLTIIYFIHLDKSK